MQRLSIGYNNNHMCFFGICVSYRFHYVEGAMDQFRVFGLKDSSEPFYSLTYAIAPILKVIINPIVTISHGIGGDIPYWICIGTGTSSDLSSMTTGHLPLVWGRDSLLLNKNRAVLMIVGVMINTLIVKRIAYARKNNSSSCQLVQKLKGYEREWECQLDIGSYGILYHVLWVSLYYYSRSTR